MSESLSGVIIKNKPNIFSSASFSSDSLIRTLSMTNDLTKKITNLTKKKEEKRESFLKDYIKAKGACFFFSLSFDF